MLQSVTLRDYMLPRPVTIGPDASVLEAMELITDNRISGLCVVDAGSHLLGVLSELDCLRAILNSTYNKTRIGLVRDYMVSENLAVVHPDDDIVDVAQGMLTSNQRRRPVVEGGRLIGQITCRQLLRAVSQFQDVA